MPTVEQARSWYPDHDPVHGFDHVLRVYRLAEKLAFAEGADVEIVRAAALLHDAQIDLIGDGASEGNIRENHHHFSADLAARTLREEGWAEEKIDAVRHCIQTHRFRDASIQPQTLEAKILFDADKLDAIGANGIARAIAYAVQTGQPYFAQPSPSFKKDGKLEPGEPHSAYHEYIFKLVKIKDRLFTPTARKIAETRQLRMIQFFEDLSMECRWGDPLA